MPKLIDMLKYNHSTGRDVLPSFYKIFRTKFNPQVGRDFFRALTYYGLMGEEVTELAKIASKYYASEQYTRGAIDVVIATALFETLNYLINRGTFRLTYRLFRASESIPKSVDYTPNTS